MRARTDAEIEVRGRDIEIGEELIRHRVVVMLTGMDEDRCNAGRGGDGLHQRSDLDEVWASAGDDCDSHAAISMLCYAARAGVIGRNR